ncbi:hypothetical protein EMCRGX_G005407 [Ephydatia muelleri]
MASSGVTSLCGEYTSLHFCVMNDCTIVHKMEISLQLPEVVSGNAVSNWPVPHIWVFDPVVSKGWQTIHGHQDLEPEDFICEKQLKDI